MHIKFFAIMLSIISIQSPAIETCEDVKEEIKPHYECDSGQLIGEGSFGKVFEIKNAGKGRKEAMKTSLCNIQSQIDDAKKEYNTIQLFDHPNIIKAYNFDQKMENCLIFLEYADDGQLYKFLTENKKTYQKPADLFPRIKELAEGIMEIHSKGYVHADLRPENIVKFKDGTLKIIDFGLMRELGKDYDKLVGTAYYIDPVLFTSVIHYDWYVDVHALGVMAYEMAFGLKLPFNGNDSNEILGKIQIGTYEIPPTANMQVAFVIHSLLRHSAEDRIKLPELIKLIDYFLANPFPQLFGGKLVSSKEKFPVSGCSSIPYKILEKNDPAIFGPRRLGTVSGEEPENKKKEVSSKNLENEKTAMTSLAKLVI